MIVDHRRCFPGDLFDDFLSCSLPDVLLIAFRRCAVPIVDENIAQAELIDSEAPQSRLTNRNLWIRPVLCSFSPFTSPPPHRRSNSLDYVRLLRKPLERCKRASRCLRQKHIATRFVRAVIQLNDVLYSPLQRHCTRSSIHLHGNKLIFDPPYLVFTLSPEASFCITLADTALGFKTVSFSRSGLSAPLYSGLTLGSPIVIECSFIDKHVPVVNHHFETPMHVQGG